ncbi:hypothetical protein CH248_09800 [Rhodococcus sp. 06-156-4a]|nr:hypothetical protein CH280_08220 [Rhodococcus sp. 06-156-4C]OZD21400.1 hypothetical protein CH248_09800 [Rhodococcus sp. 06-156-4a]
MRNRVRQSNKSQPPTLNRIAACELLAATGIAVQIPGMTTTVLLATFLLAAALLAPVRRECE